jgi:predicted transglutaminase-like cysteine proteinase
MTATQTTTIPTESSPPPAGRPAPPRRRILLAAGLVVFAAAALIVWLLVISSPSQTGPITPISAPEASQQAAPAPGQANAGSSVGSVDTPGGYAEFCQNSPVLCSAPAAPAPANVAYLQFCQNSPTLCAGVVPKRPEAGYVQFCQNNPVLCTKPN